MSDNKKIYEDEFEFDDEIDFEGLDEFSEEMADIVEEFEDVDVDFQVQELSDLDSEAESEEESFSECEFVSDEEIGDVLENDVQRYDENPIDYDELSDEETDDEYEEPHIESEQIVPVVSYSEDDAEAEFDIETEDDAESEDDIKDDLFVFSDDDSMESDNAESDGHNEVLINRFCIINTAISAVTLCAVAAGIAFGYNYIKSVEEKLEIKSAEIIELEKKNEELEEDYLEVMNTVNVENSENTSFDIPEIENGKIGLYDTSVGYSWVPVLSGVEQNDYKKENFSIDSRGRISYTEDGEAASYFGIDVSSYQGDINWQAVREDNVEFAFLRIGYRGYGEEGKLCADEKFVDNYIGAHDAGIDLGIYFFSQATTVEEAIEEADYVLSLLEGRTLEYPIVFDWETVQTSDPEDIPRTEDVMPSTLTLSAIAFCETIRDAGYDAMIYTNKKLATIKYDLRQLQDYPIWLAYYNTELDYRYEFDIWQYGTGQVDGIEGEVDINIAMIK